MTRMLLAALWLATVAATYRDDGGQVEAYTTLNRERASSLGIPHPRHTYGLEQSQDILRGVLDMVFGVTAPREAVIMSIESKVAIHAVGDSTRIYRPPAEYTDGKGYTYFVIWPGAVPESVAVTARDTVLVLREDE